MKAFIFTLSLAVSVLAANSQTWKTEIEKTTSNHRVKVLRIKPTMQLTVGSILLESDSLKRSINYYGDFMSGTADSLKMRLKTVTAVDNYSNGIRKTSVTPARFYPAINAPDSNIIEMALRDVHSIDYSLKKWRDAGEIGEPVLFLSLFTLLASPLISYNFKEGKLNADRYKYWALGSTIGVAAGFAAIIVINAVPPHGRYQFKEGWPNKKAKVWKFR